MRKPSEEQVREEAVELLEPFGVSPSGIEHCGSHISVKLGDTFRLIYSDRFETVSYAGDVTPWKIDELPVSSGWMEAYKKIQSLLSEPTLQEQVKACVAIVGGATVASVDEDNGVAYLRYGASKYAITSDLVFLLLKDEYPTATPVPEYLEKPMSEEWKKGVASIAALLTPPEPTLESQIAEQQRVIDGLREELKREHESVKGLMIDFGVMRDKKIALQRENESLLDKFGPIDEAECKAAASVTELAGLVAKQADIQDEIFQMIPELVRNIATEAVQVQGRANRCSCGPAC